MARSGTFLALMAVALAGLGLWLLQSGGSSPATDGSIVQVASAGAPPKAAPPPKPKKDTAESWPELPEEPKKKAPGGVDPAASRTPAAKDPDSPNTPAGFRPQIPEGAEAPDPIPGSVDGLTPVVLESGVKYWDIKVGDGVVPKDDGMIIASFRAWLMKGDDVGELVDSSTHQRYNPPFFKKSLIPGLQEALWTMRDGGTRQIYLPADQAWGEKGKPPAIPPNSEMLYQVQLMEVRNPPEQRSVAGIAPQVTKNGVKYWDLEVGEGDVVPPRADIKTRYTGWLEDGTVFDTTELNRQPMPLSLSQARIIVGWREGIPGMRVGGTRRLEIPSGLAYGPTGSGPIPPDEDLVFEVQVIEASAPPPSSTPTPVSVGDRKPVKTDKGLIYWELKKGDGATPSEDAEVIIHYSIWLEDGTIILTTRVAGSPMTIPLNRLNQGMQEGIRTMKVGGIRQLHVPPHLGYGEKGSPPEIPPNATLTMDVELVGIK